MAQTKRSTVLCMVLSLAVIANAVPGQSSARLMGRVVNISGKPVSGAEEALLRPIMGGERANYKEQPSIIEGQVVDALNRRPKAGVDVVALALSHRGMNDVLSGATKTELLQHVKTDLQGRFRLPVRRWSPDDIALEVFAFAAGRAIDWACFEDGRGEYLANLCLPPEQQMIGRVVGPRNTPEANVKVFLRTVCKSGSGKDHSYPFPSVPDRMMAWPQPAFTDKDGRFTLYGIPCDTMIEVEVNDDRFARQYWEFPMTRTTAVNEVTLRLAPPRLVEGSLLCEDKGAPVCGASVALTSWDDNGRWLGAVEGRTDAQGAFHLRPYYGDFLEIRAMLSDNKSYRKLSRRIPWPEGTITQKMTLTLQRIDSEEKETHARPPQAQRAPELVVPVNAGLPAKTTGIRRPLPRRIYAAASFQTKTEDGQYAEISGIIAIDPENGKWVRITSQGQVPRVSPDGKRLAFPTEGNGKGTVTCINQPNSTMVQIFPKRGLPVWSPDGKSLIVTVPAPAQAEYHGEEFWGEESAKWQLRADGSEPRQLPLPPLHDVEDWSPDGRWLATHWDTHSAAGSHLYVMHLDGNGLRQLTAPGYNYSWNPRFSPDGKWILYKHLEKGRLSVNMIDFDATTVREVFAEVGRTAPETACWSPDGLYVAVLVFNFSDDMSTKGDVGAQDQHIVIVDVADASAFELRLADAVSVTIAGLDWR